MKPFSLIFLIFLSFTSCKCNQKESKTEDLPCGVCPSKELICVQNKCQCPDNKYQIGNYCYEKDSNNYSASFKNTPFSCKGTGTIMMPPYSEENKNDCNFALFFPDGFVAQTGDARYYNFLDYELVTDNFFPVSYDFENGICEGHKITYTAFSARRNIGSNEVSVFFSAYDSSINAPTDTFTIVFSQ